MMCAHLFLVWLVREDAFEEPATSRFFATAFDNRLALFFIMAPADFLGDFLPLEPRPETEPGCGGLVPALNPLSKLAILSRKVLWLMT
jgi:hypothetical protein